MQKSAGTRYRDSSAYSIAAIAALIASALFDAVLFFFVVRHLGTNAAPAEGWLKFHLLIRIATACAFLTWFDSAYANLAATYGTNYARWWAIGGFFIPPFALFRPCEIAMEIWRRTSKRDGHPIVAFVWWGAVLQVVFAAIVGRPVMYYAGSVAAAGASVALVMILSRQLEEAHLEAQREERRLRQEAKRAPVPASAPVPAAAAVPATPAPAAPPLAPHLAAIDTATAQRAAERRTTATYTTRIAPAPRPAPVPATPPLAAPATAPIPTVEQTARRQTVPAAIRIPAPPKSEPALPSNVAWIRALALFLGVSAVAMLAAAARVAFNDDVVLRSLAIVYGCAGVLVAAMAAFFLRYRGVPEAAFKWAMITLAGAVVAMANVVAISGIVMP